MVFTHVGMRSRWLLTGLLVLLVSLMGACGSAAAANGPSLAVASASLIVAGSGETLYSDNPNAERAIASTTKIMTALVTLQQVSNLNTRFTQMNWTAANGDSQIGLTPGERMSVHDLLLALLIPSADDAAMDLAYNVGGHSIARFVTMMNQQAASLGLTHTHYTTPSGLDTPGNYSTSADLVKLANYVMAHYPFFRHAVAMSSATLSTGDHTRHVTTTNGLLGEVSWIDGIKTGHTADAGYVLVAQGHRDGMTLIDSVLGTSSEDARDANALALLNWGYANFQNVTAVRQGAVVVRAPVDGSSHRVAVLAANSFSWVVARGSKLTVVSYLRGKKLSGPLAKGATVGTADVESGGKVVGTVPLVLAVAVAKPSSLSGLGQVILGLFSLLLLVGAGLAILAIRGRTNKRPEPARRSRRFEHR